MKSLTLAACAALALLVACTGEPKDQNSGTTAQKPANTNADPALAARTVSVQVEGMSCGVMCPPAVREQLVKVEGVESVTVDFPSKTASVLMKDGTDRDALKAKLKGALTGQFSAANVQ